MTKYLCNVDWDTDDGDTAPEKVVTVTHTELEPFLTKEETVGDALVEYLTDKFDFLVSALSYKVL